MPLSDFWSKIEEHFLRRKFRGDKPSPNFEHKPPIHTQPHQTFQIPELNLTAITPIEQEQPFIPTPPQIMGDAPIPQSETLPSDENIGGVNPISENISENEIPQTTNGETIITLLQKNWILIALLGILFLIIIK